MADNVTIPASGTGTATPVVATDDVAGVHFQKMKLDVGGDGATVPATGDVTNGLDVDVTRVSGTVTISGTVTANAGTGTQAVDQADTATADYDTGAGTVNQTMIGLALPASGGPVAGGTASAPVRVDPTGTTTQPVSDAGGSLTVDGSVSITGALPAGANNIGDVDVLTLPALPAGTNNIGDVDVLSLPAATVAGATAKTADLDSGAGTDTVTLFGVAVAASGGAVAVTGDTGNGLDVDVTRLPALAAGTNNIGDVDVLTLPAGTVAGAASLPAGTNNIGDVDVLSLPAIPAGGNNIGDVDIASFAAGAITEVQGDVAHDAAAAGNPVLVGLRANQNEPTAVADADSTFAWGDQQGRQVVVVNFPAAVAVDSTHGPKTVTLTLTSDAALVAAPGAGQSIYVTSISASNTSATKSRVDIKDGTTIRYSMMLAADGGGFVQDFNPPWKITANTALNGALGTAVTDVRANIHYFVAP